MKYIEIALFIVGVVALVIGYRKNRRNVLLCAAIVLVLACTVGDFAHGFQEGFRAGWYSVSVTKSPA